MLIVYDLDGTLIDTRTANRLAYEAVDVSPPKDFHTLDWRLWTTPEIHDAKNKALRYTMTRSVRELPLMKVARRHAAFVLSNISPAAFSIVKDNVDLGSLRVSIGLVPADKVFMLQEIEHEIGEVGIYVDDSFFTCQMVAQMTSWQVLHAGKFAE